MPLREGWSKEKSKWIEMLNKSLGMSHRTKPYDINNPEDLDHMICQASGKYMDALHYAGETSNLLEELDESIETFYPAEWASSTVGVTLDKNNYMLKGYTFLRKAEVCFDKEEDKNIKICIVAWKLFLQYAPEELLLKYTGSTSKIDDCEFLTEDLLRELMIEVEWPCSTGKSANTIGAAIRDYLESSKGEE